MRSKQILIHYWDLAHKKPAWLSWLIDLAKLTDEEIGFLEDYDDQQDLLESELKEKYYNEKLPEVKRSIAEWKQGEFSEEFIRHQRKCYLESRREKLQDKLRLEWIKNKESKLNEIPLFLRKAVWEINKVDRLSQLLERIKRSIYLLEKKFTEKRFTEEQIDRALSVPTKKVFESVGIKVRKGYLAKCPFHSEKKSSCNVKGNFFFCHGCGTSGNNIDFLMRYLNLSFREAVKRLLYL